MKKIITVFLSLIISFLFAVSVYAADISVTADTVNLSTTDSTMIPVTVKGNGGLMGFKITVEYPVDKVEVKAISRGELTSKGNFNTNFGINDGKFDVLWNNTQDIKEDGTLFVISAQAKTEIKKNTKINLSFSQPDTFNESYEDVKLNCKDIIISAKKEKNTEAESTEKAKEESAKKEPSPINSSQVTDAVKVALEKFDYDNLSEVKDEKEFIKEVNKNLETITGSKDHNVKDYDSLKSLYISAYEGEFVEETTNNNDSDKINNAIEKALQTVGAKSIDEIDEKDKKKFVNEVEKNLKSENPDTPDVSKDLETEDALNIIKKVNSISENEVNQTNKNETKSSINTVLYIVIGILVLLIAVTAVFIFIKKKK